MNLSSLGISADEERIYRFLLQHPGSPAEAIAASLALDPESVSAGLKRLYAMELARLDATATAWPANPTVAVERLVQRRQDEISQSLRDIAAARGAIPDLVTHQCVMARDRADEHIYGLAEVNNYIDDLLYYAHEVLSMHPRVPNEELLPKNIRALSRNITMRTIIRRTALKVQAIPYYRKLHDAGDQIRVIDDPVQKMMIFDRSVALLPVEPDNPARGALVLRHPGAVITLVDLFERTWNSADDLLAVLDDKPPNTIERQVLDILSRVGKDEAGAREMGVSVRTFRKHVADLMSHLGAANRFQAGLLAKSRGWL
ncbi:hypothetical protein [Streptosporangium sp. NPDC000396]|uniref:hypothetical protein n=1 Tax=Streptosporangium sp. NPDC000396 TaxID=3366185 RepID=UPI0036C97BB6